MHSLRHRRDITFFGLIFLLVLFLPTPCFALIVPPDPFESTDRFALLNPTSDGTITKVLVKAKAPGQDPLGSGELWALLRYKQPSSGSHKFHFAASNAVFIQGLSNSVPTLIEFDFSKEPIPAEAHHRTLLIYFQQGPEKPPILLSRYRPDQLLSSILKDLDQAFPSPPGGTLIFGPVTFVREREKPITEQVSFSVSENTGAFLLRLTNGTPGGAQRVSSALVKLNGKEIFKPSDFNQKVAGLSRQVSLLYGENLIEVRLRSAPGSLMTLEIVRLDSHMCRAFDPRTFNRSKGKPKEEIVVFEINPQFFGPFTLSLTSGDSDGSHRVDSAIIRLNGEIIFDPNDFNEQISYLSREVSLEPNNTLTVELRGAPGDFLAMEIIGYESTPPKITIIGPSNGDTFKTGPISVSGTVDDPTSFVVVNGIAVPVASDGSFSLEGITLSEGENIIRAVATDWCDNQGEDQIKVYLRTVPQGPYLLFCPEPFYERRPDPPELGCSQQTYEKYVGTVAGLTDETAVSVTLDGILLPEGVMVSDQGSIYEGIREGNFFWAFIDIPQVDGAHPFTAVVTNAEGGRTEATVFFMVDNVPPHLTITSPQNYFVTNNPIITITGTVDDPEAIVRLGWWGPIIPVLNGTFSMEYTLRWEGWNSLSFSARDPAENTSSAYLTVILDTIPPQINITNPTEGKAVNTPTLNVTGSIIDSNKDTVTVEVNNGPPQPLTLIGSNFSGIVSLNPGPNTLAFNATDKAGNSNRVTRSVTLDTDIPAVAITSPISGAILSGTATITVESSDGISGIASVALFVDGQLQTTLNQPPFNFTLDTSMLASGQHTITVRTTDGAGNQAEATVDVTVDNTAPFVAITSPGSGAFVSGLITVSVQASDAISGVASVSLYVDGLLQTTLTQPLFNFPLNTLLFASGSHTITARGVDNPGNQAETSIILSFDHVPPAVSITSPASGAMVSGMITVQVEASDSISGVASVTLYVDNQPHSTLNQPPFNFTVDTSGLVPGSHTLTARAIDRAGNQGETGITIMVVEAIRIEITAPTNGATINKSGAIVLGRIYNQSGEIGVNVNGSLAQVQGGDFAVIVPLQVGQNTITATATRPDGVQGQASITINTETQQEFVRLTATPTSGILDRSGFLNVTFEAEAYLVNPVSSYSWDFNGDGTPEIIGTEASITAQYQYPGLYFPKITVTDTQGNAYTQTTLLHIVSREEMDTLLRSKWEGMKGALSQGNIEGAISYFDDFSKAGYKEHFTVLSPIVSQIVQELNDIQLIRMMKNAIEYDIRTIRNGKEYSFYFLFVRDKDGLWKIRSF